MCYHLRPSLLPLPSLLLFPSLLPLPSLFPLPFFLFLVFASASVFHFTFVYATTSVSPFASVFASTSVIPFASVFAFTLDFPFASVFASASVFPSAFIFSTASVFTSASSFTKDQAWENQVRSLSKHLTKQNQFLFVDPPPTIYPLRGWTLQQPRTEGCPARLPTRGPHLELSAQSLQWGMRCYVHLRSRAGCHCSARMRRQHPPFSLLDAPQKTSPCNRYPR